MADSPPQGNKEMNHEQTLMRAHYFSRLVLLWARLLGAVAEEVVFVMSGGSSCCARAGLVRHDECRAMLLRRPISLRIINSGEESKPIKVTAITL